MDYLFLNWSTQEEASYRELLNDEINKLYIGEGIDLNPVNRTKYLLKKMNLSDEDYEIMVRYEARPEILSELELTFLNL